MRDISKRVIVNTVLAGGANVVAVGTDGLKVLQDAGAVVLPPFDKSKLSTTKIAAVAEVQGGTLVGVSADGTVFTPVNSARYQIKIYNTQKKQFTRDNFPESIAYTAPSASATRKAIVDALVAKVNSIKKLKVTASNGIKLVVDGATAAPAVGTWIYQGASLAAATWKARVIKTIEAAGGWDGEAGCIILAGAVGGSGSLAVGTAIKNAAGAACTGIGNDAVLTSDVGVAIFDDGSYFQGEFPEGPYTVNAGFGFVESGVLRLTSYPAVLPTGSGAQLLANMQIMDRSGRDLHAGKHDWFIDVGVPAADKTYDLVIMELYESSPDQNQAIPKIPKYYEVYVENSNSTNVTNLVSALTS